MKIHRRKAYNGQVTWSEEEENMLLEFIKNNRFDRSIVSKLFPNRTLPAIRNKVRKLRLKYDLFGESYRKEKEEFTLKIAKETNPNVIFEAYGGIGHQTFKWINFASVIYVSEKKKYKFDQFSAFAKSNGFCEAPSFLKNWNYFKNDNSNKQIFFFKGDAVEAASHLRCNKVKVDLLDLDTCGTSLPTLPTLLTLTKPKFLVITHGEFHSLRFKREDVLRRILVHRNINESPLPLSVDMLSEELDKAVKVAALRAHNETIASFWLEKVDETWLGSKIHGMLRRYYKVGKTTATADHLNELAGY